MTKKLKTPIDYLEFFTKDFEPDDAPKAIWKEMENGAKMLQQYSIKLPKELKIRHPYIVFIIFVNLKRYKFLGRWEKVAWEIPIKYKGTPFILTHRKFGFDILSNFESDEITEIAIEAMTNIHKSMKFAENLIEPEIKSLVHEGAITLDNEYSNIRNRYEFFRENAQLQFDCLEETKKNSELILDKGIEEAIKSHNDYLKKINAGNYYLTGMLDAYYSLLEHILVLILPFIKSKKLSKIDLESYIGDNWKEKYKAVIPLNEDKVALKLLERLDKIKEDYRNPLTHGYFKKNGHSFYVHMKNLGAIPMTLTKSNSAFRYHFGGLGQFTFVEICKCFDDCDTYFDSSDLTKYGMKYIKRGLSIAYDSYSCKRYQDAMKSVGHFDKFIDKMTHEHENAMNMDW